MGECKVFVGNLNFKATQLELHEYFRSCEAVKDVAVIKDKKDGRSKGYAFVMFENEDAAKKAVEKMNDQVFQGRPLAVKLASNQDNNRAFTEFRGGKDNNQGYWQRESGYYPEMGRNSYGQGGYGQGGYGHGGHGGYEGDYRNGGGYGGGYGGSNYHDGYYGGGSGYGGRHYGYSEY